MVLHRRQTNIVPSYIYPENIIFKKSSNEKGDFFAFNDVFNLNMHFFHSKGSSYFGVLSSFQRVLH